MTFQVLLSPCSGNSDSATYLPSSLRPNMLKVRTATAVTNVLLHFTRRRWLLWHRKRALSWLAEVHTDITHRLLPSPVNAPAISDDDSHVPIAPVAPSQAVIIRAAVPPYGQRAGWRPTGQEDFGESCQSMSHALRELMI
jgi:hypothetical protein